MRWIELAGAALLAAASTGAMAAQDPFTDVPKGHWAYKAISKLRQDQMINGYKGRYYGDKAFTRYEMAVILSRYFEQLKDAREAIRGSVAKTYPLLEKLSKEFAKELDLLGVKTTDLDQRLSKVQDGLGELRGMVRENQSMIRDVVCRLDAMGPGGVAPRPMAAAPASEEARPLEVARRVVEETTREKPREVEAAEIFRPEPERATSRVSELMGDRDIRSSEDVDRLLLETIAKVKDGRLTKTQAYSVGYLANILYRRVKDMNRPGIHRGLDSSIMDDKIAKLEETLTVKRSRSRRPDRSLDVGIGQAE